MTKKKKVEPCTCNRSFPKGNEIREKRPDGFERVMAFGRAHDCELPRNDGRNHGIGSMEIRFVLIGPKGAVQVLFNTGWYLPKNMARIRELETDRFKKFPDIFDEYPQVWDLGYHSPVPRYAGQNSMGPCHFLGGKVCYYDGSSLNGKYLNQRFLRTGPDAVWREMRRYYNRTFRLPYNPRVKL